MSYANVNDCVVSFSFAACSTEILNFCHEYSLMACLSLVALCYPEDSSFKLMLTGLNRYLKTASMSAANYTLATTANKLSPILKRPVTILLRRRSFHYCTLPPIPNLRLFARKS